MAITRHGATIGIYVPTKPESSQADLEALRVAGEKMQELIAAAGTSESEIVGDLKKLRSKRRRLLPEYRLTGDQSQDNSRGSRSSGASSGWSPSPDS